MLRSSIITKQNAPRSIGSTCGRHASPPSNSCTMRVATRSESVVAEPVLPTRSTSSAVFTRLPLWPRARLWVPSVLNAGWAFSQVVDPVVEYRVCPIPRSPCRVASVASLKTWETRPSSL